MSFVETRLELGVDYDTRASLRFNTGVLVDGSGAEQRNANWSQPLGKWTIGDRSVSNTELDYFLDFHAARKGSYEGFRFKDWTDYQAKSQQLGTGDGSKTQFQLVKTYTVGSSSVKRPILKPVGNTVKIKIDGTQVTSGWSVDITTGVITFATAPNNGVAIAADFEFDVPVRFEQDKIDFRFDAYEVGTGYAIFQLQNLSLVELRLKPTINIPPSQLPSSINEVLDLGYDYGTVGGPAYNTSITAVGAGYEKRTSNWDSSRGKWQIGDRTLNRAELDYFIAFFRIARGAASGFTYFDWASNQNCDVRFESDSIEFRFDAIDLITQNSIFYLSGTSVIKNSLPTTITYNALASPIHSYSTSPLSCYTSPDDYVLVVTTDRPSYCGAHLNPYTLIYDRNTMAHGSGPGPDGPLDDVVITLSNPSTYPNHFPGFTDTNTFFRTKSSYYTDIQCSGKPNYTITESWEPS